MIVRRADNIVFVHLSSLWNLNIFRGTGFGLVSGIRNTNLVKLNFFTNISIIILYSLCGICS